MQIRMVFLLLLLSCTAVDGKLKFVSAMNELLSLYEASVQKLDDETPEEISTRKIEKNIDDFDVSPEYVLEQMEQAGFADLDITKGNVISATLSGKGISTPIKCTCVVEINSIHVDLIESTQVSDRVEALGFANSWNQHKRYSTAYIDEEGDIHLEAELYVTDHDAVDSEALLEFLQLCRTSLIVFTRELQNFYSTQTLGREL